VTPDTSFAADHQRSSLDPADAASVEAQLGRVPRAAVKVAWRCPCGKPGVVMTAPQLPDGAPFPTTYYLTCPRATKAVSTLEGSGMMAEMTERLRTDPDLADRYEAAHRAYLADRQALAQQLGMVAPQIDHVSAGGMPERVKCLHALVGHALAAGPGVNPFGDEALAALGDFWATPCVPQLTPSADACGHGAPEEDA